MKNRANKNFWYKHGHTVIIYVFLAALVVFVSIFDKDLFTLGNPKNLLRSFFPLLMAALGQTLVILMGGVDLSLGGIVALRNVVCVLSTNLDSAWGFVLTLGVAVAVGLAYGVANGILVTKGRLAPIIVTIATIAALNGMALLLTPDPGGDVHKAFTKFLTRGYSGAAPFLLSILILCLVRCLANNTPYGKALRAIGGSENAAYSADIWVGKIKLRAYYLAGPLCAVTGILLDAQMNSTDATIGKNYVMDAITATVVGGTAMIGVVEDPLRTITGVFIISIISSVLNLSGVSSLYQFICQGLMLIAALSSDMLHKRRQRLWGLII